MLTKLEFRDRFTQSEKIRVELASADDPSAPIEQRMLSAAIRSYIADMNAVKDDVDETDPRTIAGVQALEDGGLLDFVGRASQILAPTGMPPPDAESFTFPADMTVPGASLAVVTAGTYSAHDLVECYAMGDETRTPIAAYSAIFIATGEN